MTMGIQKLGWNYLIISRNQVELEWKDLTSKMESSFVLFQPLRVNHLKGSPPKSQKQEISISLRITVHEASPLEIRRIKIVQLKLMDLDNNYDWIRLLATPAAPREKKWWTKEKHLIHPDLSIKPMAKRRSLLRIPYYLPTEWSNLYSNPAKSGSLPCLSLFMWPFRGNLVSIRTKGTLKQPLRQY